MERSIQNIRLLGLDMINQANSGHPGIVLGAAPTLYALYQNHMNASTKHPLWFNRDRFFLAAGHGSALIYALLHCAGYDVPMEEIKRFRQLNSMTPGHPEYLHTPGIDATTGPLGQGLAMAVGSAIAEVYLRHLFNKDDLKVVDHYTYVLCGDGDLQEGVSLEAMSFAGHVRLNRLIILFDSNDVQLDGPTLNAVSEDIAKKVESVGFDYQCIADANDVLAISKAIAVAKKTDKPSFIEIKSVIGYGAKNQGTSSVHGAPIGREDTSRLRKLWDFNLNEFEVEQDVYADFREKFGARGSKLYREWIASLEAYAQRYPELHQCLMDIIHQKTRVDYAKITSIDPIGFKEATRNSSGKFLKVLSEEIPHLIGGSADLTASTKAKGINGNFSPSNPLGRNICFGVREHAMGAIANGMALHYLKAFASGFFVFSDYMKPPIRLAALMKVPTIFIFTHDSVGVGEDGPTHEPVEQLAMFRSTPDLITLRPADSNETRFALRYALESQNQPVLLALSRQDIQVMHQATYEDFLQGGYIASDRANYEGILIASGSEVEIAIKAQKLLEENHQIAVRVVSMPSMELFLRQPKHIQDHVLPPACQKRLAIEMGASGLWYRFAAHVKGIDSFGKSGKLEDVLEYFGFTPEAVANEYLGIR